MLHIYIGAYLRSSQEKNEIAIDFSLEENIDVV